MRNPNIKKALTPGPDRERIRRIRQALKKAGLDAVVARAPENIQYLSGFLPGSAGNVPAAIFTADGEIAVMAADKDYPFLEDAWPTETRIFPAYALRGDDPGRRFADFLKDCAKRCGFARGSVAYEGSLGSLSAPMFCGTIATLPASGYGDAIRAALPKAKLVDGAPLLYELRGVKTAYELERMRRAAGLAAVGNLACKEALRPGMTEAEIAVTIESAIGRAGAECKGARRWRGFAFVGAGRRSAITWIVLEFNKGYRVRSGDLVLIEMHVMVDGYWTDHTRTYAVGRPTARQREVWAAVAEAQRRSMAADRPGATGQEIDAAGRAVIEKAGLGAYFPHHTGHGTGLCSHEPPFIHPFVPGVKMAAGATHSCEPGVYIEKEGIGCRIEDIVETTPEGAKYLYDYDRTLD